MGILEKKKKKSVTMLQIYYELCALYNKIDTYVSRNLFCIYLVTRLNVLIVEIIVFQSNFILAQL